jgi:putative transposase
MALAYFQEMPMRTGRPVRAVTVSAAERAQLQSYAQSRALPAGQVVRAKVILAAAAGASNTVIAATLRLNPHTVGAYRQRWLAHGLAGVYDAPRSGRPRVHDDEAVVRLLRKALRTTPRDATQGSVHTVAAATRIPKSTVQRYFALFRVQPHRTEAFRLSTDPFFVEKVRDIVGLYFNPPDHALVLCVDEKSQIQALERTQPNLPMSLGYVEGVTHDYTRHGTTTLFAALEVPTGTVLTQCKPRHRHQEFLRFLRHIDAHVPSTLDVHVIIDNYVTHKHAAVKVWLATHSRITCATRRPTVRGSIK